MRSCFFPVSCLLQAPLRTFRASPCTSFGCSLFCTSESYYSPHKGVQSIFSLFLTHLLLNCPPVQKDTLRVIILGPAMNFLFSCFTTTNILHQPQDSKRLALKLLSQALDRLQHHWHDVHSIKSEDFPTPANKPPRGKFFTKSSFDSNFKFYLFYITVWAVTRPSQ